MTEQIKNPHLKLMVFNPALVPKKTLAPCELVLPDAGFMAEVCKVGPRVYEMSIQDPFHDLKCDLFLDIQKDRGETAVVCHFPDILNESNRFLKQDETLYGIIVIQFQMNVLEQLFLFCGDHKASRLIIYMDDAPAEAFEIYHHFLAQQDRNFTTDGEQTTMVISVNQKKLDHLHNFMQETNLKFDQGLWRKQQSNPAIRHYLQSRAKNETIK